MIAGSEALLPLPFQPPPDDASARDLHQGPSVSVRRVAPSYLGAKSAELEVGVDGPCDGLLVRRCAGGTPAKSRGS